MHVWCSELQEMDELSGLVVHLSHIYRDWSPRLSFMSRFRNSAHPRVDIWIAIPLELNICIFNLGSALQILYIQICDLITFLVFTRDTKSSQSQIHRYPFTIHASSVVVHIHPTPTWRITIFIHGKKHFIYSMKWKNLSISYQRYFRHTVFRNCQNLQSGFVVWIDGEPISCFLHQLEWELKIPENMVPFLSFLILGNGVEAER